jgi:hypothetical protein
LPFLDRASVNLYGSNNNTKTESTIGVSRDWGKKGSYCLISAGSVLDDEKLLVMVAQHCG